jgi:hypothetical protein
MLMIASAAMSSVSSAAISLIRSGIRAENCTRDRHAPLPGRSDGPGAPGAPAAGAVGDGAAIAGSL